MLGVWRCTSPSGRRRSSTSSLAISSARATRPPSRRSATTSASRSLATVHKHLTNLQDKGLIKRAWNRSRALELVPTQVKVQAVELPLLGRVAAGTPIEAIGGTETIFVPEDMVGKKDTYVLQVRATR